jgi:hypothetical protein
MLSAFLNELSQPRGRLPIPVCKAVMSNLVSLLRAVRRVRTDLALHSAGPFKDMIIGADYPIARWCNDGDCKDEWLFLRALENRSPFGEGLEELLSSENMVEYRYGGTNAEGLGWAHLADGIAVSFDHSAEWRTDFVSVVQTLLTEGDDGAGELIENSVVVRHAAQPLHLDSHKDWFARVGRIEPRDPTDLWGRRQDLFKNLMFLDRCKGDIAGIHPAHPWFSAIVSRLRELDEAVQAWDPARQPEPLWTSRVTHEHSGRQRLCMFIDQNGNEECYDLHARFTPGAGRLHFRLDATVRKAKVAYIGLKIGV